MPKHLLFMDARTKRKNFRLTAFAETAEELARTYQDWVRECDWTQKDMWYANIFEVGTDKHVGYVTIGPDAQINMFPVEGSKVSPYRRNLKQIIDWFK